MARHVKIAGVPIKQLAGWPCSTIPRCSLVNPLNCAAELRSDAETCCVGVDDCVIVGVFPLRHLAPQGPADGWRLSLSRVYRVGACEFGYSNLLDLGFPRSRWLRSLSSRRVEPVSDLRAELENAGSNPAEKLEPARFTVELQARRGLLSFSRGEKVAGTAG